MNYIEVLLIINAIMSLILTIGTTTEYYASQSKLPIPRGDEYKALWLRGFILTAYAILAFTLYFLLMPLVILDMIASYFHFYDKLRLWRNNR